MKTTITFLRHGQTAANRKNLFCGSEDPGLDRYGKMQVARAGALLCGHTFDTLYYGHARRVAQTAEIVLRNLAREPRTVIQTGEIREIDFGLFEGLTVAQIERKYPEKWQAYMADWQAFTFPEGDSVNGFYRRCGDFIQRVLESHEGENLLLVAHKGFILNCLLILQGGTIADVFTRDIQNGEFITLSD